VPVSVFLTAKLKVHNPSRRKRAVLDHALEEYTRAYAWLLGWAKDNLPLLEKKGQYRGRFTETAIRKALPPASAFNTYDLHSSARDSLLVDVAGALCSYFRLRDENPLTAFPTCRDPRPETYPDALEEFASVADDERDYNERRDRLSKVARGAVMPVYFARPDGVPRGRNFSLLCDPAARRYYAIVFLLPGRGGGALHGRGNLARMGWPQGHDAGEPPPRFHGKPSGALVLPLALGRWHAETFLDPCLRGEANVRSAFLSRADVDGRDADYYVHVTFEFSPPTIETETFLGVDRGISNLIALTVTDGEGRVLHQELHPGDDLVSFQKYVFTEYRRRQRRGRTLRGERVIARANEEVCHRLANVIADVAVRHRSQVVMERLKGFKEQRRDFGLLKRAPLQRIEQILEYKLPVRGLPPPRTVNPAYTSRECPRCGYGRDVRGKGINRPSQAQFRCERCGYETHADLNGSHNIARRWIDIRARPKLAASTLTTA